MFKSILHLFIFYNLVANTHKGICSIRDEILLYKYDKLKKRKVKNIVHIIEIFMLNIFVLNYCILEIYPEYLNLMWTMPVLGVIIIAVFYIRAKISMNILLYELRSKFNKNNENINEV